MKGDHKSPPLTNLWSGELITKENKDGHPMIIPAVFVFFLCCHGNQSSAWIKFILATFVKVDPRIIPAKFNQILPSAFRGDAV